MTRARKILAFLLIISPGGGSTPVPSYSPSLDFSDERNSQYMFLGLP